MFKMFVLDYNQNFRKLIIKFKNELNFIENLTNYSSLSMFWSKESLVP